MSIPLDELTAQSFIDPSDEEYEFLFCTDISDEEWEKDWIPFFGLDKEKVKERVPFYRLNKENNYEKY